MQVSTEKLQIRRIMAYNAYWFAIRFQALRKLLKLWCTYYKSMGEGARIGIRGSSNMALGSYETIFLCAM